MHEKDKERRLLNLKIKELERIIPQNKLNPISRDKSAGPRQITKKKMKNSTINDANKSMVVTKKEARMKRQFGRNIENKSKVCSSFESFYLSSFTVDKKRSI